MSDTKTAKREPCPDEFHTRHRSGPNVDNLPTGPHMFSCPTCGQRVRLDVINFGA